MSHPARAAAITPRCRLPVALLGKLALAVLTRGPRSFRADACASLAGVRPPPRLLGEAPAGGPGLIVVNHFARPGFRAWWIPLLVSALVPVEVHWVMTAAWTFPDRRWTGGALRPAARWLLRRLAQVYGFTTMPAMPPEPAEAAARAAAVRRVLSYARRTAQPVIGLAPEGRDFPGGVLGSPPPGAGRFLVQLAGLGLTIVPAGVFEADGRLMVSFGPRFQLEVGADLPPAARDSAASHAVMRAIAAQLPACLRGAYA